MQQVHPLHQLVIVEWIVESSQDLHGDVGSITRIHLSLLEVQHHALLLLIHYQPCKEVQKDSVAQE